MKRPGPAEHDTIDMLAVIGHDQTTQQPAADDELEGDGE